MSKARELAELGDSVTVDSGNVGIGTSLPDRPLHVTRGDGTGTVVKVGNTGTSSAAIEFSDTGTTDTVSIGSVGNDLTLKSDDGDISLNTTGDPATASLYVERGGKVGIGTSSPAGKLDVNDTAGSLSGTNDITAEFHRSDGVYSPRLQIRHSTTGSDIHHTYSSGSSNLTFSNGNAERMRIDSSGTLFVAKTALSDTVAGHSLESTGRAKFIRDGSNSGYFGRLTSDGAIVNFAKDGSTVGSIGNDGANIYIGKQSGLQFQGNDIISPNKNGVGADNIIDLGQASLRFDDIYATNGTIQTSDINEKQDIEELNEAEARVAVACKGLLRKFRWKDSVAEKGDDARIHFGIMAQDLQAAFAAEGLDAGEYAMFISTTWWELDGQTYDTAEEAPEGATERTRLGVRYPELLAFIISAI